MTAWGEKLEAVVGLIKLVQVHVKIEAMEFTTLLPVFSEWFGE